MNKICEMFGGIDAEQQNTLMTALWNCAGGEENLYEWFDNTPKTTLVVFLSDELKRLGYYLVKYNSTEKDMLKARLQASKISYPGDWSSNDFNLLIDNLIASL